MREQLTKLHAALQDLKRASMFRKALMAETAIIAAVELLEQMMDEIEKLKEQKNSADKPDQ